MTTHLYQIREVETFINAGERVGIDRREVARRILRDNGTSWEGGVLRRSWSDFQKIIAWASELAPEMP